MTVSKLLRLLMIKEQMSKSLRSLTKNERFAHKNLTKIIFFGTFLCFFASLKKTSDLLIPSFLMNNVSKCSGHSPKMSDVSESLKLLVKNEGMSKSIVF